MQCMVCGANPQDAAHVNIPGRTGLCCRCNLGTTGPHELLYDLLLLTVTMTMIVCTRSRRHGYPQLVQSHATCCVCTCMQMEHDPQLHMCFEGAAPRPWLDAEGTAVTEAAFLQAMRPLLDRWVCAYVTPGAVMTGACYSESGDGMCACVCMCFGGMRAALLVH